MDNTKAAKITLVTIIAGAELAERVTDDLKTLGAMGFTQTRANGRGLHGPRTYGIVDGANMRIETLVPAQVAERILAHLVAEYEGDALTAFSQEVNAVPVGHFAAKEARAAR